MTNAIKSNPWPGLGSYDDSGQYKFCGRRRATNELYSLIADNAVISLYGRSGIGKTSLLKAGVAPRLVRRGYLPVYVRLSQEVKIVGDDGRQQSYAECIVRSIEKKMEENGFAKEVVSQTLTDPANPDYLWFYFCNTSFKSSQDETCTPVVILDQYEEIFMDRRSDAALLMRQLYCLVDDSKRLPVNFEYGEFRNRFRFVMSFRDDSLFRLEDVINEYNLTAFKDNRYLLKAFSRDEAVEVITEPGEGLVGVEVSDKILDKVLAMSDGGSADPAILSLLMYGLYDRMVEKGASSISVNLVDEAGSDVVRGFYEQGMSETRLSARKYLEENLVSSDGRRRSVAAADVSRYVNDKELELLLEKHIITKLERGRFTDYELTHDVLCPIVVASRAETQAKERIAKNRRMIKIMACIIAVVIAIVAVFIFQNKRLKEQRWTALGNQSRYVAEKALQLAEEGNGYLAKLLLINTIPTDLDDPERPLTAESVAALGKVFDNNSAVLEGHTSRVLFTSYSPDGRSIVSASSDNTIRIWDASNGACLKILVGHTNGVNSVSYSPDGKRIVSASADSTIRIWDASNGTCLRVLEGHTQYVNSVSYSPDGKNIVSASGRTIKICDAFTGACLRVLKGHNGWVISASYSPDGKRIVSVLEDGMIRIWNASSYVCEREMVLEDHNGWVKSASYSPDVKSIVSASRDGTIRIWDASNGICLRELKGHAHGIYSISYSPDGRNIVSASSDNTIRIWDASNGMCLKVLSGHADHVRSAVYSPDGKRIVSTSHDKTVRIWDAATETCARVLKGHTKSVESASYSPDGRNIVSVSVDSAIRIWDASTGACLRVLKGHTAWVNSASYSPDGKRIVSASNDKAIRIWDASTGACLKVLEGHTSYVESASYSPDGRSIVSASVDSTIRMWDASTGACLNLLKDYIGVFSASYSPDGKRIVSLSLGGIIRIWDVSTRLCLRVLEGHTKSVESVSYSPDGNCIVSASSDSTIRIWDASTGACLRVLEGHNWWVRSASYSPDGKSIVSASWDKTIRIWDASTGACLRVLEGHNSGVNSVSYSPDGKSIVSASDDGTIRIWDAPPSFQEMLEITRKRFKNRKLTPEEKHRYYLE